MKTLKQINLIQLSREELKEREMKSLKGGSTIECCGCGYGIENRNANSAAGYSYSSGSATGYCWAWQYAGGGEWSSIGQQDHC